MKIIEMRRNNLDNFLLHIVMFLLLCIWSHVIMENNLRRFNVRINLCQNLLGLILFSFFLPPFPFLLSFLPFFLSPSLCTFQVATEIIKIQACLMRILVNLNVQCWDFCDTLKFLLLLYHHYFPSLFLFISEDLLTSWDIHFLFIFQYYHTASSKQPG